MIRFINITGQIIEDEFCFAWYNTVRDRFIEFNNNQVWESWKDFVEDYQRDECISTPVSFTLERFYSLFPDSLSENFYVC